MLSFLPEMSDLILEKISQSLFDLVEFNFLFVCHSTDTVRPVAVYVASAERKTVMK